VAGLAARGALGLRLASGVTGAGGLGDRIRGERRLLVLEEQRRPSLSEVPGEVVGERAEQHVRAHAVLEAVVDRADLELGALANATAETSDCEIRSSTRRPARRGSSE
jgi:hypothetical protein